MGSVPYGVSRIVTEEMILDNDEEKKEIASEVLGKKIAQGDGEGFTKELDINGLKVTVTVNNR